MHPNYVALAIVAIYIIGLGVVTSIIQRSVKTANTFTTGTTGKTGVPAVLVGLMLMSEFIGTSASVGTAQEAYKLGISASWNILALAAGFIFYGFFLAAKYKRSGHNTISAVLAEVYGQKTRLATSLVMIFALEIVAVAIYAGGGTILSALLAIDRTMAIVICGVVSVLYVFMGGMKSVVYTNIVHSFAKYLGVGAALYFGLTQVGGFSQLQAKLPPEMFSWVNVGWGQIFAWFIAGVGATFSTQYVIQAINTVDDPRSAKIASFSTALFLVPFGVITALVGMCSFALFPNIKSINAFSALIAQMDGLMAGVVAAGLAASLFGSLAAFAVATATLLYKDFYAGLIVKNPTEKGSLRFIRIATIVMGLLPIVLAIYTPNVLSVTFLGKALRASLSVLVLFVFYTPTVGNKTGAFLSILASLVATIAWFIMGNPYGIDNAYVALVVPLVVMGISNPFKGAPDAQPVLASASRPASGGE
ncbi:sodium:solute symporter family protein [Bradyrhizobium sp. NP1]|uniref:sodium:solute symporter family protein n=1 Tax=Bradyrhizobium sp. NP1 TaxID=3049772 RepID=UPI0025A50313|nr:sodium:solute symporter family protein [Bradyrhizobium sp. NP1]WJR80999.1 sodium:solute symporter family protein [Bradyrhizobium sp. NP1]